MSKELDYLLYRIHEALESYLFPVCNKCHCRSVERKCDCDRKKEGGAA